MKLMPRMELMPPTFIQSFTVSAGYVNFVAVQILGSTTSPVSRSWPTQSRTERLGAAPSLGAKGVLLTLEQLIEKIQFWKSREIQFWN